MKYKDESMNELHEELAKTGVISTDFKWKIEQLASNAVREAYARGQEEFLNKFVTEGCKKCDILSTVKEKPKKEVKAAKKNPIRKWEPGEKLVCLSNYVELFKKGDIVTFKSRNKLDTRYFYCEECDRSFFKSDFKRAPVEEVKPKEIEVETKTKTIIEEKEKDVMTKGIVERVKKGAESTIKNQQKIAKTAAMLEGARVLNN